MKTTRTIRTILAVGGAMWATAGRVLAGSLALGVQLGGVGCVPAHGRAMVSVETPLEIVVPAPVGVAVAAPTADTPVTVMWNNQPVAPIAGYARTGRYSA